MKSFLFALMALVISIASFVYVTENHQVSVPAHHAESLPVPNYTKTVKSPPIRLVNYKEWGCLTRNIYYEARGQSTLGKVMVGVVVMQRVKSPQFPDTVCKVVHEGLTAQDGDLIRHKCQFSWYCDGKGDRPDFSNPVVNREWDSAQDIAKNILLGKYSKIMKKMHGVTFYHAYYVHPAWAYSKQYKMVAHIGAHLFYRWKYANVPPLNDKLVTMN